MFENLKMMIALIRYKINRKPKPKPYQHKPFGTGSFKILQSAMSYTNSSGYISLIIHEKEVVAQKLVCDDDTYDEIFNFIVAKLGGRIPEEDA